MNKDKLCQVLLVDDDLLVLDDLKEMIDWEKEGFHIAAIAGNGEEALQMIERHAIDLMIVDIEMPLLNGLDFLHRLQQKNISICSLLLTAYSRFDYAREALALGVSNYILKYELTPQLLLDNLKNMKKQSELMKEKEKMDQHYQIQNFLLGNFSVALENIMPLKKEETRILLLHIQAALPFNDYLSHMKTEQIEQKNYQNEALPLDGLDASTLIYSVNENEVYLLIGCTWDEACLSVSQFQRILQLFQSHWQKDCFMISSAPCLYAELPKVYAKLNQIHNHFYFPINRNCDIQEWGVNQTDVYEDWREVFAGFAFTQPEDAVFQMQSYLQMLERYQPPIHELLLDMQDLIHQLQRLIQKHIDDELYALLREWLWICNYQQLRRFISMIIQKLAQYQQHQYSRKVIEMMNYLKQNCEKEDVLEDLSKHMSMNREYMSKLFKKETGQSLAQRLQDIRMKKAYQLLSTTHLKIYEIAERCGYNSSQYFSMVFTKYYQCSPSEVMNKGESNETTIER